MSDSKALENVKKSSAALSQAYQDAGGKGGDGHHHNHCPFCQGDDGFMLGFGRNGFAAFKCFRPGCKASSDRPVAGTIVDLIMLARGVDSKAACKLAVEKYGNAAVLTPAAAPVAVQGPQGPQSEKRPAYDPSHGEGKRAKGKLHVTVDLAIDAAKYGIASRQKDGVPLYERVELMKYWKYTDERGEPQISVARFNTLKHGKAGKQFTPVHRDGNGWRVGLGEWGKAGKLCPLFNLVGITKALKAAGRV
jgi:hypothetical protein